jgi:streptogramin lyase
LWVLEAIGNQHYLARYGQGSSYYPVSGTPIQITADSKGNLWYTQQNPGDIVEVDPNNPSVPVAYEVPGSGVKPLAITVGGDGGIWFTAYAASGAFIGRLDPQTHLWSMQSTGAYLANAITATQTGVGFTLNDGQSHDIGVLKYDMSGFQMHAIPTSQINGTAGIAYGPYGGLWFTEWTNEGGRIGWASSLTGQFEGDVPTPEAYSRPYSITRGWSQWGNLKVVDTLWFTDQQGYIGRIDFPPPVLVGGTVSPMISADLQVASGQTNLMINAANDLGAAPGNGIGQEDGMSGGAAVSSPSVQVVTSSLPSMSPPEGTAGPKVVRGQDRSSVSRVGRKGTADVSLTVRVLDRAHRPIQGALDGRKGTRTGARDGGRFLDSQSL